MTPEENLARELYIHSDYCNRERWKWEVLSPAEKNLYFNMAQKARLVIANESKKPKLSNKTKRRWFYALLSLIPGILIILIGGPLSGDWLGALSFVGAIYVGLVVFVAVFWALAAALTWAEEKWKD